jgi:hypothetical protein
MAAHLEISAAVLLATLVFFVFLIRAAKASWTKAHVEYTTGRVEKACDSATAIIAILIPATLGLATWLYEKLGPRWYTGLLAVSTVWFLIILLFTMYMRFNFTWSHEQKFTVGAGQNLHVVYWLVTICYGLVVGFLLLAVPVFIIAFKTKPLEVPAASIQPRAAGAVENQSQTLPSSAPQCPLANQVEKIKPK